MKVPWTVIVEITEQNGEESSYVRTTSSIMYASPDRGRAWSDSLEWLRLSRGGKNGFARVIAIVKGMHTEVVVGI